LILLGNITLITNFCEFDYLNTILIDFESYYGDSSNTFFLLAQNPFLVLDLGLLHNI